MEYKKKFIAFIDILGFKSMVEASEAGHGRSLEEIRKLLSALGDTANASSPRPFFRTLCPESPHQDGNLDFEITQISDCCVMSCEISPCGIINLVGRCSMAVLNLLLSGVLIRGYITMGNIHHQDGQFIGTGYQTAVEQEKHVAFFRSEEDEKGTPFVEIDPHVVAYVEKSGDQCVKEMFSRIAKTDNGVTAVFPFQRLAHQFAIGSFFGPLQPRKEKDGVENMRKILRKLKDRIIAYVEPDDQKASEKCRHYLRALNKQLEECDRQDEIIDRLSQPFPRR